MRRYIFYFIFISSVSAVINHASSKENIEKSPYRKIEFKNQYQDPQDVVRYFCERDASGFVWSGLLGIEIQEFTNWPRALGHSEFYIAKSYKIQPTTYPNKNSETAFVKVIYNLLAIGNANNTRLPVNENKKIINYKLKKLNGKWKIISPAFYEIYPIVVESKFFNSVSFK